GERDRRAMADVRGTAAEPAPNQAQTRLRMLNPFMLADLLFFAFHFFITDGTRNPCKRNEKCPPVTPPSAQQKKLQNVIASPPPNTQKKNVKNCLAPPPHPP